MNFYQNAGVQSNKAVNAFDLIASSDKLQNSLLGDNSPLSENSKSELFNGLINRERSEIERPIGQTLVGIAAGELAGPLMGRALGFSGSWLKALLKGAAKEANILKPLGLGSTGRVTAENLTEQLAMKEIMSNPTLGKTIMTGMKDSRWLGWNKMQYTHTALDGTKTTIHYVGKFKNGILKAVDDFKFK